MTMSQASPRRRFAGLFTGLAAIALLVGACSSAATPAPTVKPTEVVIPPVTAAPPTEAPATAAPATEAPATPAPSLASGDVILATTTSTQDSGLLDVLVPAFEKATGYTVKTVAVGSGQAMKMGESGDADVLLVHSPKAEKEFMTTGNGLDRELVMHNTFLIVGPPDDPAGIKGMTNATDAFKKIAASGSTFVSRGDGSGTETKELGIWDKAGVKPTGDKYLQTGQGMGATLQVASEKGAYTLTDIATWAASKDGLQLEVDVQGDPSLLNIYHVITIDPAKWPKVNAAGAEAFAGYILSPDGQAIIDSFGVDTLGMQLFVADAGKAEDSLSWP